MGKTVYFDNNATTRIAPEVRDAMLPYFGERYGNPSSMHERTAEAISQAYREYEILKDLQYRFMEKHEKTGDGQYRTTFSDGTVIDVDYGSGTYRIMRKP